MSPGLRFVAFLALAPLAAACAGEPAPRAGEPAPRPAVDAEAPDHAWREYAARLEATDPVARFLEATALFLGTPYFNGPLGEGDAGGPDPDPRVDFTRADCVTYLEQSLALALANPDRRGSFLESLDAIRYRDGAVDFVSRNHYMVGDWIPANGWLLRDVTREIGGDHTREVRRTIDRAKFLRDQGAEPRAGIDEAHELTAHIIPSGSLPEVEDRVRPGDLVFWVGGVDGIFVLHTGLAVRSGEGELLFRHGSSKAGHALDESFAGYAARQNFEGFVVLRLRDDAAWPRTEQG